jgi:hypothetical protein
MDVGGGGRRGKSMPALGKAWLQAADVRLMLAREVDVDDESVVERGETRVAEVTKHMFGPCGGRAVFTITQGGVADVGAGA